jgi:DeoR/GlpR family transcriptional regulator of sugar metabolism
MQTTEPLFREERLKQIVSRLNARQSVQVNALAREFGVSPSMIRLDLGELETRGLLQRTHGGAILAEGLSGRVVTGKSPFEARRAALQDEKEAIGRAAAALVQDGDSLMMDSGSTTLHVARALQAKRNLTIVTNAIDLLPDLLTNPDSQIYISGGLVNRDLVTLLGEVATDVLGRFRTAKAILGIDGISIEHGLSATDPAVAASKRRMIAASKKLIVVADHTKLNQISLYNLAPLEAMHTLVTDSAASIETVETIRACGVEVILAPALSG